VNVATQWPLKSHPLYLIPRHCTSVSRLTWGRVTAKNDQVNLEALKSEIRAVLITHKATATPICIRVGWHASGTFDVNDKTGGSNGAAMRFEPENNDPANAGLSIIRDMLYPVHLKHPEISLADLWNYAAAVSVELCGGPKIPFKFGRTDFATQPTCPVANGRLPDAAQGADHLRHIFYRMGFNDQEIVALSGAHTLGRCHISRSGFDGPWTSQPLIFNNAYYVNLLKRTWVPRKWDGPLQYEDEETESLMMLPTDMALVWDDKFKVWVEKYAKDQDLFFKDFANVYARLLALGCPETCDPFKVEKKVISEKDKQSAEFREHAMHGSLEAAKKAIKKGADVNQLEPTSNRSALHKAAFWGHEQMTDFILSLPGVNANLQDCDGDTALHDAAKFGHVTLVKQLAPVTNLTLKNKEGRTALQVAQFYGKPEVVEILQGSKM
jgi:catalase (peroxidase I)